MATLVGTLRNEIHHILDSKVNKGLEDDVTEHSVVANLMQSSKNLSRESNLRLHHSDVNFVGRQAVHQRLTLKSRMLISEGEGQELQWQRSAESLKSQFSLPVLSFAECASKIIMPLVRQNGSAAIQPTCDLLTAKFECKEAPNTASEQLQLLNASQSSISQGCFDTFYGELPNRVDCEAADLLLASTKSSPSSLQVQDLLEVLECQILNTSPSRNFSLHPSSDFEAGISSDSAMFLSLDRPESFEHAERARHFNKDEMNLQAELSLDPKEPLPTMISNFEQNSVSISSTPSLQSSRQHTVARTRLRNSSLSENSHLPAGLSGLYFQRHDILTDLHDSRDNTIEIQSKLMHSLLQQEVWGSDVLMTGQAQPQWGPTSMI